jgi:hypothetical protein
LRSPPPSITSASASIRWSTTIRVSNPLSGASPATTAPSDRSPGRSRPPSRRSRASRAPSSRRSCALRRAGPPGQATPTHSCPTGGLSGRVRPARAASGECPVER